MLLCFGPISLTPKSCLQGFGAVCVPHECLPANYLSSASNYWGVAGESVASSPGKGGRWGSGPWGWGNRASDAAAKPSPPVPPLAPPSLVPPPAPPPPALGPTNALLRRTSFSCNDLERMRREEGAAEKAAQGKPSLRLMAPPLDAALRATEVSHDSTIPTAPLMSWASCRRTPSPRLANVLLGCHRPPPRGWRRQQRRRNPSGHERCSSAATAAAATCSRSWPSR